LQLLFARSFSWLWLQRWVARTS